MALVEREGQRADGPARSRVAVVHRLRRRERGPDDEVAGRNGVEDRHVSDRHPAPIRCRRGIIDGGRVRSLSSRARRGAGRTALRSIPSRITIDPRRRSCVSRTAGRDLGATPGVARRGRVERHPELGDRREAPGAEDMIDELVFDIIAHTAVQCYRHRARTEARGRVQVVDGLRRGERHPEQEVPGARSVVDPHVRHEAPISRRRRVRERARVRGLSSGPVRRGSWRPTLRRRPGGVGVDPRRGAGVAATRDLGPAARICRRPR